MISRAEQVPIKKSEKPAFALAERELRRGKEEFPEVKIGRSPAELEALARRFDELVYERVDLVKEYQELTGKSWAKTKEEKREEEEISKRWPFLSQLKKRKEEKEKMPGELLKELIASVDGRLKEIEAELEKYKKDKELKEAIREMYKRESQIRFALKEVDAIETRREDLDKAEIELIKKRKGRFTSEDEKFFEQNKKLREAIEQRVQSLEFNPEIVWALRLRQLNKYKEQLEKGRFAETPSRKKYLDEIRDLWEEGKNVFLSGPTGTGKTELLVYMSKKFYGEPPEVVRGSERVGPPEIFGKTLLQATPEGGTKTYFQPGRYTAAIDEGKPLVFDEFNLIEDKIRMQLKELYNRRPGDEITIQEDAGNKHKIKEGFVWAATANIKSEKHRERFELDPAEARIFEMRRIDYLPKEEVFDLICAKLISKKGDLRVSFKDKTQTFPQYISRLLESAELIQSAYLGTQTSIYEHGGATKKKYATLEKAVLDPGRILGFVDGWEKARVKGKDFDTYLENKMIAFLNTEDFPEKDRRLLLQIFVTKGFFKGRKPEEFFISGLTEEDLKAWGWEEKKE